MKGADAIRFCCALALVSSIGIVGMLLAQDAWDWFYFALALLPVLAGIALLRFLARGAS